MVRKTGFDPVTSCTPSTRSAWLSYVLIKMVRLERMDNRRPHGVLTEHYNLLFITNDKSASRILPAEQLQLNPTSKCPCWVMSVRLIRKYQFPD